MNTAGDRWAEEAIAVARACWQAISEIKDKERKDHQGEPRET